MHHWFIHWIFPILYLVTSQESCFFQKAYVLVTKVGKNSCTNSSILTTLTNNHLCGVMALNCRLREFSTPEGTCCLVHPGDFRNLLFLVFLIPVLQMVEGSMFGQ